MPLTDLKFGPGTCKRHREMFVDLCVADDLRDWLTLERLRMLFIAETARRFPAEDIRRWLTQACVGCEQEAHCIGLIHKLAAEEKRLALIT